MGTPNPAVSFRCTYSDDDPGYDPSMYASWLVAARGIFDALSTVNNDRCAGSPSRILCQWSAQGQTWTHVLCLQIEARHPRHSWAAHPVLARKRRRGSVSMPYSILLSPCLRRSNRSVRYLDAPPSPLLSAQHQGTPVVPAGAALPPPVRHPLRRPASVSVG
jgi:hypothetical protein